MSDEKSDTSQALEIIPPEQRSPAPLAIGQSSVPMRVEEIVAHKNLVHEVMKSVMLDGTHYGTVGTVKKPTLLQPGAQILCVTFRLVAKFTKTMRDLGNGHREWIVDCNLSTPAGVAMGYGCGSCSTMEEKYRWRTDASDAEDTGHTVPSSYWAIKDKAKQAMTLRQICNNQLGSYGVAKLDAAGKPVAKGAPGGVWKIVKYPAERKRVENENLADTYNTALKIACKRALVHAVLNTTGASDIFTQDVEDMPAHSFGSAHEPDDSIGEPVESAPSGDTTAPPERRESAPAVKPPPAKVNAPAVKFEPGSWKAVQVESKDGGMYHLGSLSLANLEAIHKNRIVPLGDLEKASTANKKLAAAVAMGITEVRSKTGGENPTAPPKPDDEKLPGGGNGEPPASASAKADDKPTEPAGVYEWPADAIKKLRELCDAAVITEGSFLEHATLDHMMPAHDPAQPITSFDDDRLNPQWLQDAVDTFAMLMLKWKFKSDPPPVAPKPRRAGGVTPRKPSR